MYETDGEACIHHRILHFSIKICSHQSLHSFPLQECTALLTSTAAATVEKRMTGRSFLETLKRREPFILFLLTSLFKSVNDLTEGAGRLKLKHSPQ